MTTLIEQLILKMGLHDEPNIFAKTTELLRLLDLRSTNMPMQVNEYGKIVLCADLAANVLNTGFDKEHALKLSGLKKSHYANNKRMFEKLLDINKLVGVQDICLQLSLNEVSTKAKELYDLFKKVSEIENTEIDVSHPQYAAMAVFFAGKLLKKKLSKTKLMPFSHLRPTQWLQLEKRWEKFIENHYKSGMDNKLIKNISDNDTIEKASNSIKTELSAKTNTTPAIEDYEKWRERILVMAKTKLEQQEHATRVDKENFVM